MIIPHAGRARLQAIEPAEALPARFDPPIAAVTTGVHFSSRA
ncbi:hypothetical protein [Actinoplanes sp. ATCC 53533]|nr:hypothetical protein [Actinoplanes sp. ATCC 53533]